MGHLHDMPHEIGQMAGESSNGYLERALKAGQVQRRMVARQDLSPCVGKTNQNPLRHKQSTRARVSRQVFAFLREICNGVHDRGSEQYSKMRVLVV